MSELIDQYEALLPDSLYEEGFSRPPLLARHHNDTITMAVMAMPPDMIFRTVMQKFMTDLTVKEIIFGVDRYTEPGQGTKYADVFTIFWWQGEREENYGFRFGVVNYRPPPHTVIEPIDWHNTFWNDVMAKMIADDFAHMQRRVAAIREAGGGTMVDAAVEAVREMQERARRGEKPS